MISILNISDCDISAFFRSDSNRKMDVCFVRAYISLMEFMFSLVEAVSAKDEERPGKNSFSSRKRKHRLMFMGHGWGAGSWVLAWEAPTDSDHSLPARHFHLPSDAVHLQYIKNKRWRWLVRGEYWWDQWLPYIKISFLRGYAIKKCLF